MTVLIGLSYNKKKKKCASVTNNQPFGHKKQLHYASVTLCHIWPYHDVSRLEVIDI